MDAEGAMRLCLAMCGAVACGVAQSPHPLLDIPHVQCPVVIDGRLDEPCYQQAVHAPAFVVASRPAEHAPPTDALLFWNADHLVLAFDVVDRTIRAEAPGADERAVDNQDRVEVFLWSGRTEDAYACIEISAKGAVHDYLARFYRRFDSTWSPSAWTHAVSATPLGYRVELELAASTLEKLGLTLTAGARWRLGLFRADFSSSGPSVAPTWVTWVDAGTPQADFHVAEAFGEMRLR